VDDNANVRSYSEVIRVRDLVATGLNNFEIARLTGIPRPTVRDWRATERWRAGVRTLTVGPTPCDGQCGIEQGLGAAYAYLLGLYLGDGCLSEQRRSVYRLRIVLDARYPGVINECTDAMAEVLPANRPNVQRKRRERAVEAGISSKHLPCLFPQHGPGRKHERVIRLCDWQRQIVDRHPHELLRGLVHSDGCRFTNTIRYRDRTYAYPRYTFSNRSDDIRAIFCDACDLLGVEWRVMNRWNISVARRASVARLDEFVGPKA
jgi:hypothetical protein